MSDYTIGTPTHRTTINYRLGTAISLKSIKSSFSPSKGHNIYDRDAYSAYTRVLNTIEFSNKFDNQSTEVTNILPSTNLKLPVSCNCTYTSPLRYIIKK